MRQLATLTAIVSLALAGCAEESREPTAPPAADRPAPDDGLTRAPAGEERARVAGPAQGVTTDAVGSACPIRSRDVQVATSDIENGVAIELSSDRVPPDELQYFAEHLAKIEDGQMGPQAARGTGPGAMRGTGPGPYAGKGPGPARAAGPGPGQYMRKLPASNIEVERSGQRVWMTITARNPDDAAEVRELGRAAAEAMRTGECPIARE